MKTNKRAVVLLSGGQDSTTCLFWAKREFDEVYAIGFDYGQKHKKENALAKEIADMAGVPFKLVSIDSLSQLHHNALTDSSIEVCHEKPERELPNTFVPGRNLIFLTYAAIYAYTIDAHHLVTGVSEADYSGYPDCRNNFARAANVAISLALDTELEVHTPLMWLDKSEVWKLSDELGVLDLVREKTLTCYNGIPADGCGECPACKLRRAGLQKYLNSKK